MSEKPYNLIRLSKASAEEHDTKCRYGIGKQYEPKQWFMTNKEREAWIKENNLEEQVNRSKEYKF